MKKELPYLIGGAVLLVLIIGLVASRAKPAHRFDERITLRQQDKIPYGTAVARFLLPALFPEAQVRSDAQAPGEWNTLQGDSSGQAVILVADFMDADNEELNRIAGFVEKGNVVFIIARTVSDEASGFFHLSLSSYNDLFYENTQDSLRLQLQASSFDQDGVFTYPGKRYESSVRTLDSLRTVVLGKTKGDWANFVEMKKGAGRIYLHTSPLAFSNYFILHKQNVRYYQAALSVIPKDTRTVIWNEYYLQKAQNPRDDKEVNWLGALFRQPSFRWGFLAALATLLLYLLLGMRRQQRVIPPYTKPRNDSLDFVKTLGRLYFDKGDHKNLAEKMSAYFLEHVRSKYKIATHTLDEEFVQLLQAKSGYPAPELGDLVHSLLQLRQIPAITEEDLAAFHKQLELFYQNT